MTKKKPGWYGESQRHALAAKGVKTGTKDRKKDAKRAVGQQSKVPYEEYEVDTDFLHFHRQVSDVERLFYGGARTKTDLRRCGCHLCTEALDRIDRKKANERLRMKRNELEREEMAEKVSPSRTWDLWVGDQTPEEFLTGQYMYPMPKNLNEMERTVERYVTECPETFDFDPDLAHEMSPSDSPRFHDKVVARKLMEYILSDEEVMRQVVGDRRKVHG